MGRSVRDGDGMDDGISRLTGRIEAWQMLCNDAEASKMTAGTDQRATAMTAAKTI